MQQKRTHIPPQVVEKAAAKLQQLLAGTGLKQLNGQRLKGNSNLITISMGAYRLLCIYQGHQFHTSELLHHAAYEDRLRRWRLA